MKYIIEIEDEPMVAGSCENELDELWKAKGFNSLVFDQNGLNKLTPYIEEQEIKRRVINEICSKFAANEYYYGDSLKSAFICMAEGKEVGQIKHFCLGENEDNIRQKTENEVWEIARDIINMDHDSFMSCFKGEIEERVFELPYREVKNTYNNFKASKIQVGDEVVLNGQATACVVYGFSTGKGAILANLLFANGQTGQCPVDECKKTGKRYGEVIKLLKQMMGGV